MIDWILRGFSDLTRAKLPIPGAARNAGAFGRFRPRQAPRAAERRRGAAAGGRARAAEETAEDARGGAGAVGGGEPERSCFSSEAKSLPFLEAITGGEN